MLVMFTSWLVVRRISFLVFSKGIYIIIIQKQGIISVYLKVLILTLLYHIYWEMIMGGPNIFCNIKKPLFYHINNHQIQVIQILFKNRIYVKSWILFKNPSLFRNLILFKVKRQCI